MNSKPSSLLQAFAETPWAIMPNKLAALAEIVERHANGEKLSAEEIEARIHGAARPQGRRVQSVAVLPLFGTIFPRANLMTEMSGATSAEIFGKQFDELLKDPEVDAIVLDVNSPGGSAYGIEEISNKIFDARGQKPITAVANHLMASAAYWIGTAADELVVTPSGDVGSVGVFAVHEDYSVLLEKAGIKTSIIKAGRYKAAGNPYEPLGEEARSVIQTGVDEVYDAFVGAVARNRGVKAAMVRSDFGEGRVVGARESVKLGMADRVGTLDETIQRLLGSKVKAGPLKASHLAFDSTIETQVEDSQPTEERQEPSSDNFHTQEARARLASVGDKLIEGDSKMLRNLLKQRGDKVARAQEIVDLADAEERDLTEDERAEFAQLLGEGDTTGEIGALDSQITRIQDERERLRSAAGQKFSSTEAEKPVATAGNIMKRSEFEKLDAEARSAFVKARGKIED